MRLLYVGMRWDYGDFTRGESFEHWNFYHSLRSYCLQRGWSFHYYDFMERGRMLGREAMTEELYQLCRDVRPDLLFSALFDDGHDPHLPVFQAISDLGTVTINWFCDDHWRYEGYSRHVARYFDRVCTTAESALPKYRADGMGHKVIKSQWACNHELYRPTHRPQDVDLSFVGMNHGNRAVLLDTLRQAGLNLEIYGHGWADRPRLKFPDMVELFGRSKINLNLSNSSLMTGQQIKGRNFEVPGCGAFLLTGMAENLEQYFINGKETVIFQDEAEVPELARYYLSHEAERRRIAEAGYERVLAEHTWHHRFNAIFREVEVGPQRTDTDYRVVLADTAAASRHSYLNASRLASMVRSTGLSLGVLTHGAEATRLHAGVVHHAVGAADLANLALAPRIPDVFCTVSSWELFRLALLPASTLKAAVLTDDLPDAPTLELLDLVFCVSQGQEAMLTAQGVPESKIRRLPLQLGPAETQPPSPRSKDTILVASHQSETQTSDTRLQAVRLASQHRPDLRVQWPDEAELRSLLEQSSLVLFPVSGGWPGLTPLVAQSFGCLPIVPERHPLSATVINGETGVVLKDYSPTAIALVLLRLRDEDLDRMRSRASMDARDSRPNQTADAFRAAIADAIGRRS